MKTSLKTDAAAEQRRPAYCEPLWRYQDVARALPVAARSAADDEDAPDESPASRPFLRCVATAPRPGR